MISTDTQDAYGIIGHPVKHSWSPFIHGLFAKNTGQSITYRLYDVPPESFSTFLDVFFGKGGKGLNVTVPHKVTAADIADELSARATRARSVNTLTLTKERKISGDNTDGAGLVIDLRNNLGFTVTRKRVLILGAGGAARGILAPLLTLSPKEIVLANRTPDRAAAIAAEFGDLGPMRGCGFDEVTPEPFHLIVNATSASLQGSVPQVTPRVIDRKTLCYDMAYSAGDTPFVRWAAQHGCARAVQGWGMLVEQAAEAFWIWRSIRPDTEPVIQALRRHPGAMARAG